MKKQQNKTKATLFEERRIESTLLLATWQEKKDWYLATGWKVYYQGKSYDGTSDVVRLYKILKPIK